MRRYLVIYYTCLSDMDMDLRGARSPNTIEAKAFLVV